MIFGLEAPLVDVRSWRGQAESEHVAKATQMELRGFCVLKENPEVNASFYKNCPGLGSWSHLGGACSGTQDPALTSSARESPSSGVVSSRGSLRKSEDKIRLREDFSKDDL